MPAALNQLIAQKADKNKRQFKYLISKWTRVDHPDLYKLEQKAWAPWMQKPQKNFDIIAKIFPDGQRKITDLNGEVIAMISTNRINWNGSIAELPTWDSVAGGSIEKSNFSNTYIKNGNTLDIMSITVDPSMHGKGLATILFMEVIYIAKNLGVNHLICSFRPNLFGEYKYNNGYKLVSIDEYCKQTTVNGLPGDPWLRIASRYGMIPLKIENSAIKVEVPLSKFYEYQKTHKPEAWFRKPDGQWECGEAGCWTIKNNMATYVEPNLWGEIPLK